MMHRALNPKMHKVCVGEQCHAEICATYKMVSASDQLQAIDIE